MSSIVAALEQRLTTAPVAGRITALAELRDAARAQQPLPHDDLLELLRVLGGFGRRSESVPAVREAIHHARRAVALARGRARGLRAPHPVSALDDEDLVFAAIALVWDAVSIYDGVEVLDAGLALATPRQRHLFAFWWTQSEVRNGGFFQYFANPSGIVAPLALEGLRALGATAAADALAAACRPFERGAITERAYRHRILASLERRTFAAHDAAFCEGCPHAFELAAAAIRAQPAEVFE